MKRTTLSLHLKSEHINNDVIKFIEEWKKAGQVGYVDLQVNVTKYNYTEIEKKLDDLLNFKVIDQAEYDRINNEIRIFKNLL